MRIFLLLLCCSNLLVGQSDSVRLAEVMADFGDFESAAPDLEWRVTNDSTAAIDLSALNEMRGRVPNDSGLDAGDRINRDILLHVLDDLIYQRRFGAHRFPLDSEGGFLAEVVYHMINARADDSDGFARHRKALSDLPRTFDHHITNLRAGLAEGRTDPALVVRNCIDQIERQLATPVAQSIFLQAVSGDVARTRVLSELVEEQVYPAYRGLRDFLRDDYLPNLRPGIGISEIPGGKDYYRQRVRYFTTYDVTPEEVFATGQAEVARIRGEMDSIIDRTGFGGSFEEFLLFLRTDERFYAKTPYELLARASYITKRMEGLLPRYFHRLPRMPLTVTPVPEALAPNYTVGRYSPGSFEDERAGAFWVNTYDLPSRPLYVLPALALHEGVPGHHTQIMLAAELEGVPKFRKGLYLSAYGEGWGLYAEYLGKEAGIYESDYEAFGALVYEMWRACRLVVDPGIHYFGWTRAEAVDFLAANTALSLHEVNTEIDRYIGWPGQAVSYKMGELKIRGLRTRAEAALGAKFDLAAFHDLLLGRGSVTMRGLEGIVTDWIDSGVED